MSEKIHNIIGAGIITALVALVVTLIFYMAMESGRIAQASYDRPPENIVLKTEVGQVRITKVRSVTVYSDRIEVENPQGLWVVADDWVSFPVEMKTEEPATTPGAP